MDRKETVKFLCELQAMKIGDEKIFSTQHYVRVAGGFIVTIMEDAPIPVFVPWKDVFSGTSLLFEINMFNRFK